MTEDPQTNNLSTMIKQVGDILPPDLPVYLVGGAVRDSLLGRTSHDLDFVLARNALRNARKVADSLHAAYYPLDEVREYGRVVLQQSDRERLVLDFTMFQGENLAADLRARDFTVNAMAVDIHSPQTLIDPLGGLSDLNARQLITCSDDALIKDPVRILRGLRLAINLNFHLAAGVCPRMRQAIHLLASISPERLRDELFRILAGPNPAACIQALELIGGLQFVFPELNRLKNVPQSLPHTADVWQHTLSVIRNLVTILNVLAAPFDPNLITNQHLSLLTLHLGRYRQQIIAHFDDFVNSERSLRSLLIWSALFHDIGKPETFQKDADGRIHFINHEHEGEIVLTNISRAFNLSNAEIDRAALIVNSHLRPKQLTQPEGYPSRQAIYRFFRKIGVVGIDVCLLSLADVLGTYGPTISAETWVKHLQVVELLFEAWWERTQEVISPVPMVNGNDLIREFHLFPGPQIGKILEAVKEAQAIGDVNSRRDAIEFVRVYLENKN